MLDNEEVEITQSQETTTGSKSEKNISGLSEERGITDKHEAIPGSPKLRFRGTCWLLKVKLKKVCFLNVYVSMLYDDTFL